MKTYTTKTAANGATLYYSTETGKRIAKAVALENERNYLLANAEEITAEDDDEEIVDEIDDEEEVSEELDTEDSVEEIDEDAEDDDENEVNENDVTEELNEDRRALETINPEEIVAIATVKMNIAEDEMKLAEAEVDKAYAAAGRISAKTSDEKRKAAYARIDAADAAYKTACEAYQASRKNLEAAYEVANGIRYANIKAEETTEATEQVAEVSTVEEKPEAGEYKPQTSWENPHEYETVGDLDTERYLAARNHFTTVEELLPELDELKTEIDTVNDKFLRVSFAIDTCKHFFLNKACAPFFLFRHEYNKEADTIIKASVRLYDKCIAIDFDKTFEHLSTFQYIDHGIRNETYHKAWEIFEAIRDNLGDKVLASELSKLADEFGIDRALLLQSDDCRFNPALFDEKPELPELTETNSLKKLYAEINSKYYAAINLPRALQKHVNIDALYSLRETLEEAMDSAKPAPPETPAAVAPVETNLTDKYQAALEGVYVEDEVGDFVPAAGMTNVATDNLMVYRKGDSGFMEEDPDKYVELLDMEEELEDIMVDEKIAEENRKLDEAFAETAPKPTHATFKVGEVYRANWHKADDELANFKILSRSAKFVTVVPVAFADWGETTADRKP